MKRKTSRRNIAIPDPDIAKLEAIAEKKGLGLPDIVRKAIDEYLEKHVSECAE